jgi:hypothetical protein
MNSDTEVPKFQPAVCSLTEPPWVPTGGDDDFGGVRQNLLFLTVTPLIHHVAASIHREVASKTSTES